MNTNKIDTVFVLTIFCVFAVSVLLVIMFSASAYSTMTDISQSGRDERILMSYVRMKVRNADRAGDVQVGYFYGHSALLIQEEIDGRGFLTAIYLYDGAMRELFHERGTGLQPEDGTALVATEYLRFEAAENGMIRVITEIGESLILPRSGGF